MKHPGKSALTFVLIFAGIVISIYLVVHHFDLLYGLRETKSFCSVSTKFDCDAVNSSRYSEIAGVPVAMLSLFVFVAEFLLLLGIQAFGEEESQKLARYFMYLSALFFGASIMMGMISTLILKTFCLMCASLWLVGLLVFLLSALMVRGKKWEHVGPDLWNLFKSSSAGGSRGILFLFLAIPLGSWIGTGMWKQNLGGEIEKVVQTSLSDWQNNRKFEFFITDAPASGPVDAPVQIVEFSDYLCPHCKRAAPSLHAFVNAHRDSVRMIYQMLPLDNTCNKKMTSQVHEGACLFARAALCADKQNRFSEVHDWLFDHQEELAPSQLDRMASELHLDKKALDACLSSNEVAGELQKQIERADGAGVQGTPSVFVNGRLLPGGYIIPILEAAYMSITGHR